jgi:hypothetical protein
MKARVKKVLTSPITVPVIRSSVATSKQEKSQGISPSYLDIDDNFVFPFASYGAE